MIDQTSYSAFAEELEKISGWLRKGWEEIGGEGSRGGWFGKAPVDLPKGAKLRSRALQGWRRVGSKLPIGGKAITVGLTAASLPSLMKKKDPLGFERSRAERATAMGAGTVGGIAGMGAAATHFPSRPIAPPKGKMPTGLFARARKGVGPLRRLSLPASLIGGIGGAMLAERAATAPFKAKRRREMERRYSVAGRSNPRLTKQRMLEMASQGQTPQIG